MKGPQQTATARKSRSGIPAGEDVVFIGGIPRGATQLELREYFKGLVGCVAKVRFVIDHSTRHHKGYGFARFGNGEVAKKVVEMAKTGLMFKGKLLNVGHSTEDRTDAESSEGSEGTSSSSVVNSATAAPATNIATLDQLLPTQFVHSLPQMAQGPLLYTLPVSGFPQQQYVLVQSMPLQSIAMQAPCQFVFLPPQQLCGGLQ